jgi:ABC-2 type transport system permease protein
MASRAVARRAFADGRVRTFSFAALFALVTWANFSGYKSVYTTPASREQFQRTFANNTATRLFYGKPHNLLTVGGYMAWRNAGVMVLFAAVWGLLAAVRALRAEEESGRAELVLAAALTRGRWFAAALAAILAGAVLLWAACFGPMLAGGLDAGQSALLSLEVAACALVFAGVGALSSQLAPTRRAAIEGASAVLLVAFLLRVVADTSAQLDWMRWLTPLGWAEELRPFTGAQPLVLVPLLGSAALLLTGAAALSRRRDIGAGLLAARDSAPPRMGLLGSPTARALREERLSLAIWIAASGFFALIIGLISTTVASAGLSTTVQQRLKALAGGVSIITPSGYIGFTFIFFVLVVSLFACAQIAAARNEESEQLETLLALPAGRVPWLAGRLALAVAGMVAIALACAVLAWAGAAAQSAGVSLSQMLEAGANCVPTALLFLGLGTLAYALLPRAGVGIAYGLVAIAFLWELVGDVLRAPHWLLEATPFQHIGLAPAQPFRTGAALVMLAIGVAAAALALLLFRRRDLAGT